MSIGEILILPDLKPIVKCHVDRGHCSYSSGLQMAPNEDFKLFLGAACVIPVMCHKNVGFFQGVLLQVVLVFIYCAVSDF